MISRSAHRRIHREKIGMKTWRARMKAYRVLGQVSRRVEVLETTGRPPQDAVTGRFLSIVKLNIRFAKLVRIFSRQPSRQSITA